MSNLNKCLVCAKPVVWSEHDGWLHWDKKEKRGISPLLDRTGHKAMSKW